MASAAASGTMTLSNRSAPAVNLPKGGGAIRGIGEKFSANPATGAGKLSIPLPASPGRSGFGPQLALTYDSGAGNGPFGIGWSLPLPRIVRKTEKGLPHYRDFEESDVYLISDSEDLVPVLGKDGARHSDSKSEPGFVIHRYRPRVEGLFARIERWTRTGTGEIHWRSISSDNVTSLYGTGKDSRIAAPADDGGGERIFTWLIDASYDDKGNAVLYDYARENDAGIDAAASSERGRFRSANVYLKRIRYGNRVSRLIKPDLALAEWLFELVFDYDEGHYEALPLNPGIAEDEQHRFVLAAREPTKSWRARPDPFSNYRSGFELRTHRRCRRVLMFHNIPELPSGEQGYQGLVSSLELNYGDAGEGEASVERELAHQGSTRFGSFLRSATQSGYVLQADRPAVLRGGVALSTYLTKSLPPLELEYSRPLIHDEAKALDPASLENLPSGLDPGSVYWVDLDGEGLSGMLIEQAGGWLYKPNLGGGRFGPAERVPERPAMAAIGRGQQLVDLAGDGQLDLVELEGPAPGFHERTEEMTWEPFTPFAELPNLDWQDPELRMVDLDGDGLADLLTAGQDGFTWYESLGEEGFGPAEFVPHFGEHAPRVLFSDRSQAVLLADMTGDGLSDIVRIGNGEVRYWPSLGHGRFGSSIAMDNAPCFGAPDVFDPARIRLADIDGSGPADIIYATAEGARIHFNQCGNRLSDPLDIASFPGTDNAASFAALDLEGSGTACLVWSTTLPGDCAGPIRYVDLLGGNKPHLLVRSANNLGAETRLDYASSTRFYLADRAAGRPWITRLPFPVHLLERVETIDHVSGSRHVERYSYHHGYFDGVEREFRGFGLVEQWDCETLGALVEGEAEGAANEDPAWTLPPVLTRTWYHTGIHLGRAHVSDFFAGLLDHRDTGEYYREPGLDDSGARALLLDDTELPRELAADEEREACRALAGAMLRQETYAEDGSDAHQRPYRVAEQNFTVRRLQPRGGNRHCVFLAYPKESLTYNYERELVPTIGGSMVDPETAAAFPDNVEWRADPRVAHVLNLEIDDFGNVLRSAAIVYPRRFDDPELEPAEPAQHEARATYQVSGLVAASGGDPAIDLKDDYRAPFPCEERRFELVGLAPLPGERLSLDEVEAAVRDEGAGGAPRRLLEHVRFYCRSDDLSGPLPLGVFEPLGLPYQSCSLAMTGDPFEGRATQSMLEDEAGYIHSEGGTDWWIPSGTSFFSTDRDATAEEELARAREHFFIPVRDRDPFDTDAKPTESLTTYDGHDLLVLETRDALGNRATAGERDPDPDEPPKSIALDYRVLQPREVMDPNRNRSAAAFDALGMVVGTAVRGKPEQVPCPGDQLGPGYRADLTRDEIGRVIENPKGLLAAQLLDEASTRIVYDVWSYGEEPGKRSPATGLSLVRETHSSEGAPPGGLRIQASFSYSDGFGREIQGKVQAEPGPVPKRDGDGAIVGGPDGQPVLVPGGAGPRWVGTGWTLFNNKGDPVRRFEPFFTDTHRFERDARVGVSPFLFYDPLGRVVATLRPDHAWDKSVIGPWRKEVWDFSDTTGLRPEDDEHVRPFLLKEDGTGRLPAEAYSPTWHALRTDPAFSAEVAALWPDPKQRAAQKDAAEKAAICAGTPTIVHFDVLGRPFLSIASNRLERLGAIVEESYRTRTELDIDGRQLSVTDPKKRIAVRYAYDLAGNGIHQAGMDSGEQWMLRDVAGNPVRSWDSRGFSRRMTYDRLRRPTGVHVKQGGVEREAERIEYGEGQGDFANHCARIFSMCDGAGRATSVAYDFKGNLLAQKRELLSDYRGPVDWAAAPSLAGGSFSVASSYDALGRMVTITSPDGSIHRSTFNEASLLDRIDVNLRGEDEATAFVKDITYNARGQRLSLTYGNGVTTSYRYDPLTYLLVGLKTVRPAGANGFAALFRAPAVVQDVSYVYDPAGNITRIEDEALAGLVHAGQQIEPVWDFRYDALDRLVEASGREHVGQTAHSFNPASKRDLDYAGLSYFTAHPNDLQALRNYREQYEHDEVGNFVLVRHEAGSGSWTRYYDREEQSLVEAGTKSNRLTRTRLGLDHTESYAYLDPAGDDAGGCITELGGMGLSWDCDGQLSEADLGGGGIACYAYDAGGMRVRKVINRPGGARREERIYLGGFEVYREYAADGSTVVLERECLHVVDGEQRIALVETQTAPAVGTPLSRYQIGNNLGSAAIELDSAAALVSYEEYHPFGTTSLQAKRAAETSLKRYRYTGKERDSETGFYYHGLRYLAPWIGIWISCDPLGAEAGLNPYLYVGANPVSQIDPAGTTPVDPNDDTNTKGFWNEGPKGSGEASPPAKAPEAAQTPPPQEPDILMSVKVEGPPLDYSKRMSDAEKERADLAKQNRSRMTGRPVRQYQSGHKKPLSILQPGEKTEVEPELKKANLQKSAKEKQELHRRHKAAAEKGKKSWELTDPDEFGRPGERERLRMRDANKAKAAPKKAAPKASAGKATAPKTEPPASNASGAKFRSAQRRTSGGFGPGRGGGGRVGLGKGGGGRGGFGGKAAGAVGLVLIGYDLAKAKNNEQRAEIVANAVVGSVVMAEVAEIPVVGPWVAAGATGLGIGVGVGTILAEEVIPDSAHRATGKVMVEKVFGASKADIDIVENFSVLGFRPFAP